MDASGTRMVPRGAWRIVLEDRQSVVLRLTRPRNDLLPPSGTLSVARQRGGPRDF